MNGLEELIKIWNIIDERSKKLLMTYAYGLAHKAIQNVDVSKELHGTQKYIKQD